MTDPAKLFRFIDKLQHFATVLDNEKNFTVHQHISQFYYMQKTAELVILHEQYALAYKRVTTLANQIDHESAAVFDRWKRDVRWFNEYMHSHPEL